MTSLPHPLRRPPEAEPDDDDDLVDDELIDMAHP